MPGSVLDAKESGYTDKPDKDTACMELHAIRATYNKSTR